MARAARFTTLIGALFVCTVCASTQTIDSISIYFAGDIMQHEAQLKAALRADGTYDYTGCFTQVTPEIEAADIAVCNFETTLGGVPYSGYPQFCSPDELAAAVRDAGFDIFLTANNHCLDRRTRGLVRTLDVLDSLGIPHLGTYRDLAERDSLYPYIIERNSMRIALLNYTYATNGIPVAAPCIVNYIDTTQIKADVIRARQLHADCIIACMHWGTEYRLDPDKSQKTLEEWLYSIGVDHIIGGHPHVVQPVRTLPHRYHAGSSLTVWSLGNYISNMSVPHTFQGLAVTTRLIKIGNITKLRGYDIHPNRTVRPDFIVVPDR